VACFFKQLGHELQHNGMVIHHQYLLFHRLSTFDGLVKSLKRLFYVIPAQAGIQSFQTVRILWIPVSTGMTTFYDVITLEDIQKIPDILFHFNWKIEKSTIFNFNRMSCI
jgi:hypothetical protein